jgi:glycosyltransferase involved in cell wall biosynthesis
VKIAWITYLAFDVFTGGGERAQRRIVEEGRKRGHEIAASAFLRRRPQRALRRTGLYRSLPIDWDADVFLLSNLRNVPDLVQRIPERDIERALDSGRAVVMEDAWVDICPLDVPCQGDPIRCPATCDRDFGRWLFDAAAGAVFVSPMHRDVTERVLGTTLPQSVIAHPMVDPAQFRPLGLERDIDVLYVGTLNEAKGYYDLVERFGADRLTLAGRNCLGHPISGTYLGEIPNEDLPRLYNRARTFAHLPRWVEPQGRTVTEAALCGCELITNDRVGAMSFAEKHRSNPDVVRTHPARFWDEFERMVAAHLT